MSPTRRPFPRLRINQLVCDTLPPWTSIPKVTPLRLFPRADDPHVADTKEACKSSSTTGSNSFFSCVCLLASMARSVNCLGQKKNCTGPFNWGEAHCAGEKVKRWAGPFQRKSLTNQTRTTTQQRGAARHGNQEPPGQAPRCTGRKKQNQPQQTRDFKDKSWYALTYKEVP